MWCVLESASLFLVGTVRESIITSPPFLSPTPLLTSQWPCGNTSSPRQTQARLNTPKRAAKRTQTTDEALAKKRDVFFFSTLLYSRLD
jgi:hypothetical protein